MQQEAEDWSSRVRAERFLKEWWPERLRPRGQSWLPYALISPAVLLVAAVSIFPALTALRVSLFDMSMLRIQQAQYVGLDNYLSLLRDSTFLSAALRTLRWTSTIVIAQMLLALPIALFLNIDFPWRGLVRTAVLVPYVVPTAVTSVIWVYLFDANFGVVNNILTHLGILQAPIAWIADPDLSFVILVLAMLWTGTPFMAIMLLAALQMLEKDLYDAASIDGAGRWQRFRYITVPQIMPTILLVLLLRTMWMSHHIDIIFLITDGGPGLSNYTIPVYAFMLASVEFRIGYASAVAVALALCLVGAALIYIRNIEQSMEYLQ